MVGTYNNNIREIDTDMKESTAGGGQNDSKKYEVLYQKE
jgi:hypothetical protein